MEIYAILAQSIKDGNIEILYISTSSDIKHVYKNYNSIDFEYHLIKTKLNQIHKDGIINEPNPDPENLISLSPFEQNSNPYIIHLFAKYEELFVSEPVFLTLDKDKAFEYAKNVKKILPRKVIPIQTFVYEIPLNTHYTMTDGLMNNMLIVGFKN